MIEDKPMINFRGKEMGLLEARTYLLGLTFGIYKANLNENEEREYFKWKELIENRNNISKLSGKIFSLKNPTKKNYLIENLEDKITSTIIIRKSINCKKHGGHKEKKGSEYVRPNIYGVTTYVSCSKCGVIYEKCSGKEKDSSNKKILNPFAS